MSNTSSDGITLIIDPSQETALRLQFVETLLDTALYGAYFVVFLTSTHFILERRKRQGGQTLMLAYSFLTFILATISVSAQAQNARVVYVDSLFHDILLSCNADIILAQISQYFLVLTGDALLFYRAVNIWEKNMFVIVTLGLIWLGSAAIAIIQFMACAPNAERLLAKVNSDAVVESWILCTVVFNIVATGLLAWRILGNRQTRLSFRASGQSSRVQTVLAVLAESAFLYTASGVVFLALYLVKSPALAIFRALFNNLAYLNPAIIALRVALSQATQEGTSLSASSRSRMSTTAVNQRSSQHASKTLASLSGPLRGKLNDTEGSQSLAASQNA